MSKAANPWLCLCLATSVAGACGPALSASGRESIRSARVRVDGAAAAAPRMTNALAEAQAALERAHRREADYRSLPGWAHVVALEGMVGDVTRLLAGGDVGRAYDLAVSSAFAMRRERLQSDLFEAMPFLVIGPFGNPAWTKANEPNRPPVIDSGELYRPFIGETDGSNWNTLAASFLPNRTNVYPSAFGTAAAWTPAVKTDALSFDAVGTQYPAWLVVYAYTEIFSPENRDASLEVVTEFGSPPMTWVGGRLVTSAVPPAPPPQIVPAMGHYWGRIHCGLVKGWNPVLMRVLQRRGTRMTVKLLQRGAWTGKDNAYLTPDDWQFRIPQEGTSPAAGEKASP